ncbi:MAG: ATP-binding protein, partial [Bacteroidota bacterium]
LYLRVIGGMACGLLIVRDKWPKTLLNYLPTFWHLTLLYCLPFTSTVMLLLTQGSVDWLINVAITIMLLIVLVDWVSFILLTTLGIALGYLFYQTAVGPVSLQLDFSTGYLLVYTCVFATMVALIFARRKEQYFEAKIREMGAQYGNTTHASDHVHPAVFRIVAMIEQQVHEVVGSYTQNQVGHNSTTQQQDVTYNTPDFLHYFFPTALEVIKQGTHLRQQLVNAMMTECIQPQRAIHSLKACLLPILEHYGKRHNQRIHVNQLDDYNAHVSEQHLQYAIIHVLRFLLAHHTEATIHLWITQQEGIHLRLSGQALASTLIHELFTLFPASEYAHNMGLAISRLLMEAHGGHLLCETKALPHEVYTEFTLHVAPTTAND